MWKRFYFDSNRFFDNVEGPDDWKRVRAAYPDYTDERLLEAKENGYCYNNFGFRVEHTGERTLRDFFIANNMIDSIPPRD